MTEFNILRKVFEEEPTLGKALENPQTSTSSHIEYSKQGLNPHLYCNTEEKIGLQFWGWELVLCSDGTYYFDDTSGG